MDLLHNGSRIITSLNKFYPLTIGTKRVVDK